MAEVDKYFWSSLRLKMPLKMKERQYMIAIRADMLYVAEH